MADIRVTQAGRQAVTQEDADVRVTQAGRQAVTQEVADVRVTQAGRQAVTQEVAGDLRVTMLGRNVLIIEPAPSKPVLVNPVQSGIYSTNLAILYNESVDPLGGTIWYHARYKLTTDTVWTDIFVSRLGNDVFNLDISGDTDGTYDFELWATTTGYTSQKNVITFTIHNGIPTEPNITAPYEGQKWQQTTNTVEWDAATDPDMDTLNYYGRYKLITDTSWNSLFGPQTGLSYAWNMTALAVGSYELEVWADDGTGPGPADHVYFEVFISDEPIAPRIRIVEVGPDYVVAELEEYAHPFSRPWQATKWELIPFGGSWTNPVVSYTTTDATEQLLYTFTGLPPGFMGLVRATFQDNVNTWGQPSTEALFLIPAQTHNWEKRWERNAKYYNRGLGTESRGGDWTGLHEQPISAIVDPDWENVGSFLLEGYVMAGGCYCGWIGTDTELQAGGIGVFLGDSVNGGQYGIMFGIDWGTKNAFTGITGGHYSKPYLYSKFENCAIHSSKTIYGAQFTGYIQVTEGVTPKYGQPIGPWLSEYTHWPSYKLELWVQRDLQAGTARVRARVNYAGWYTSSLPEALLDRKYAAGDQWDIDYTMPCLTTCGKPGYWRRQWAYAWPSAFLQFYGLKYTALRDEGLEVAYNRDPLVPYIEPGLGICVPVSEDALPAPVFFPCPPNGNVEEEWVQPTNIIESRDDSEQRVSLRDIPAERITFTTTLPTSRELGNLKALLWEEQPSRWGVPMWMDAATLTTNLAASSGTIPAGYFDPDGRRFEEMDYVAIWTDQFTWDFLPASLNPDGSITLTGTTTQPFEANKSVVIPCRIGRILPDAPFERDAPEIGDLRVTFVLEAVDNG